MGLVHGVWGSGKQHSSSSDGVCITGAEVITEPRGRRGLDVAECSLDVLQRLAEECDFLVPTPRSYLETSSLKYRSSQEGNVTTAASGWQCCHCCPPLEPRDPWGSMSGHTALCQASYRLNRYVRGMGVLRN